MLQGMKQNRDANSKNADAVPVAPRRKAFAIAYDLALDVVFPRRCAACRTWCDSLFCPLCCATLRSPTPPLCARCGIPMNAVARVDEMPGATERAGELTGEGLRSFRTREAESLCFECRGNRRENALSFDALRSPHAFDGALRSAIHRFKYEGKAALAAPLTALLEGFLQPSLHGLDMSTHVPPAMGRPDVIVPVPLHFWRRHRRGYNQSELLARELGRRLNIPVRNVLRRARHTSPQVGLSARERADNVRDAFLPRENRSGEPVANTVLLIDDVCTTGATLHECARALKQAGAARVFALTLARQI